MIEKLVTVKNCANAFEASFLQVYLESNGIRVRNSGDEMRAWTGRYSMLSRGIRLQVFPRDAAKAKRLLENPPVYVPEEEEGAEAPTSNRLSSEILSGAEDLTKCPNCGSSNIERVTSSSFVRVISIVLLLGLPLLFPRCSYICRDCDWDSSR